MDPPLQILLTKGLQEVAFLDVGIKASGKLQLLDMMLMEMRNRGLRVLILFQVQGLFNQCISFVQSFFPPLFFFVL